MRTISKYIWNLERKALSKYYPCSKCVRWYNEGWCGLWNMNTSGKDYCSHWDNKGELKRG